MPVSVPKALVIGVSNAARAVQSASPVALLMSIATALASAIARAAKVSAFIVISIRRTSA